MSILKYIPKKRKLPLDRYKTNLVMGFSYYKLLSSYTGYCVRVRRSSDSAEQDFGFVNNYIDYNAIVAFCGAGSGYVSIWYNQYASGNNALQVSTGSQARIVNSGVFDVDGLYFNGATNSYGVVSYNAINILSPVLALYLNVKIDNSIGYIFSKNLDSSSNIQYAVLTNDAVVFKPIFIVDNSSTIINTLTLSTSTNYKLLENWLSYNANGASLTNGTTTHLGTRGTGLTERDNFAIGGRSSSPDGLSQSVRMAGNIKTLVIANNLLDYSIVSKV